MSTISYNSDETHAPPAGMPFKQSPPSEESQDDKFSSSQQLSGLSVHRGKDICGCPESSDNALITAAQRGDEQAFVDLCARHSSMAKKKILGIVQNEEDAEDALQDTLLRAYTHLSSFRRDCKFSTWLTTIGMNSALMILRKRRVRREAHLCGTNPDLETAEPPEPVDQSLGPEGIYLRQQAILLVRREVRKLKPNLRSVVNQYYGSECSLEEAAKAQEISLGAAKSRLLRGRSRLRASLARYGISKFDK
jgi:RNA polymerase sigma-70 factor, ECF subfamily